MKLLLKKIFGQNRLKKDRGVVTMAQLPIPRIIFAKHYLAPPCIATRRRAPRFGVAVATILIDRAPKYLSPIPEHKKRRPEGRLGSR